MPLLAFSHAPRRFSSAQTTGWLVIGSLLLLQLGLSSAADLDSRALLEHQHISHLKAARTRTAGAIQLAFSLLSVVVSFPLIFTTTSKGALSIAVIATSLLAGILGLLSSRLIMVFISRAKWPRGINMRRFEHAWGISVGAHCVCLMATGLHVYFAVEVIYNCTESETPKGDFRPNCDANVGVLAGILPHLFGALSLAMLGISSIITAIRIATLVEQLTHTQSKTSQQFSPRTTRLFR